MSNAYLDRMFDRVRAAPPHERKAIMDEIVVWLDQHMPLREGKKWDEFINWEAVMRTH